MPWGSRGGWGEGRCPTPLQGRPGARDGSGGRPLLRCRHSYTPPWKNVERDKTKAVECPRGSGMGMAPPLSMSEGATVMLVAPSRVVGSWLLVPCLLVRRR